MYEPSKETTTNVKINEENERGVNIRVDQEDDVPMDQWDLLEDLYSLGSWERLTIQALEVLSRDLQNRNLRAAMRLARRKQGSS